jgi:hypothetical protein
MADLGKAIYSILSGAPLVGGTLDNKIYPVSAPQSATLPYLVYKIVGVEPNDTKDDVSDTDAVRVQFELVDKSYSRIVQTAEALRVLLDRFRGQVGATFIDGVRYLEYEDDFSPEPGIYQHFADYQIRYHRS